MTLADRVSALLDRRGIPHALIGAAALAAAGIARSTFDIDLLTGDTTVLEPVFWTDLGGTGTSVDVRRGDDTDPLRGVVRLEQPSERPVDVIVGKHEWQARAVARARRPADGLPIVQPRDLVLLKLYAGGTQDLWDVRELLTAAGGTLVADVEADLGGLPQAMRDTWARART